ncbi:MAG: porphobilinogen synthase, partial [Bacteroidetes bacterium]|nr:porphobilinogen synthase [Bacteroidota bacterium]
MLRRPRRNRKSAIIRSMVEETRLSVEDLIFPLFLVEGKKIKQEVLS